MKRKNPEKPKKSKRNIVKPMSRLPRKSKRLKQKYYRPFFEELLHTTKRIRNRLNDRFTYYDLNFARLNGEIYCGIQIYELNTKDINQAYHIRIHPRTKEWLCCHPDGQPIKTIPTHWNVQDIQSKMKEDYLNYIRFEL